MVSKGNATLTIKADSRQIIENESIGFKCILDGMDKSQINRLWWYKNDHLIEETLLKNARIDRANMALVLNDLSHHNDNGKYHCVIELKNSQNISSNQIDVETKCN